MHFPLSTYTYTIILCSSLRLSKKMMFVKRIILFSAMLTARSLADQPEDPWDDYNADPGSFEASNYVGPHVPWQQANTAIYQCLSEAYYKVSVQTQPSTSRLTII